MPILPSRVHVCFYGSILVLVNHMATAYGEYNEMVREVAQARGQTLVNWDFEYALDFLCVLEASVTLNISSGDSIGKTAQESIRMYDKLVREHPDTILALHHEVYGQFQFIVSRV